MNMIEIDLQVSDRLTEIAKPLGITRNSVLRQLLKIENPKTTVKNNLVKYDKKANSNLIFNNIQDELIPHIVKVLFENGGKSTKSIVEQEIFTLFQHEFEKPYYKKTVSHGVPRWKHDIAWSKERAKQLHGFIKSAKESDRGIWELTDKGISYCENNL